MFHFCQGSTCSSQMWTALGLPCLTEEQKSVRRGAPPGQSGLSFPVWGPWGLLAGANNPTTTVRLMAGPGWLLALLCHRGGAGRASMAIPELSLVPGPHVSAVYQADTAARGSPSQTASVLLHYRGEGAWDQGNKNSIEALYKDKGVI